MPRIMQLMYPRQKSSPFQRAPQVTIFIKYLTIADAPLGALKGKEWVKSTPFFWEERGVISLQFLNYVQYFGPRGGR